MLAIPISFRLMPPPCSPIATKPEPFLALNQRSKLSPYWTVHVLDLKSVRSQTAFSILLSGVHAVSHECRLAGSITQAVVSVPSKDGSHPCYSTNARSHYRLRDAPAHVVSGSRRCGSLSPCR